MKQKKATQRLNNEKSKISKHLSICTVVLHDCILYPESIPFHYRHLLRKPQKQAKQSPSCVNIPTPKRSSNNIQLSKEKVQEQNVAEKEHYTLTRLTRSYIKKKTREKNENNDTQLNNESIKTNQELLSHEIQPKLRLRKRRIISNSSNELFTSKNDKSSDISTYYSHECCNIETSTKKKKSKLIRRKTPDCDESSLTDSINVESVKVGPDNKSCLDKKNLTFVNYNRKMEGISTEFTTHVECNNNLYPVDETSYAERKKQIKVKWNNKTNQNNKDVPSNVINTELNEKIYKYLNTLAKDIENMNADAKSKNLYPCNNVPTTYNNNMDERENQQEAKTNSKNKTTTLNSAVPKIIGNNILPKGTIKVIKKTNTNSQNSASISMSKLSNSSLTVNNNMNREGENNKLCSKIINHHNLNSLKKSKNSTRNDLDICDVDNETTVIYKNYALSQEQSSELYNDEIHERSISQGSTEINEDVLKNTSNLMSENESCDTNGSLNNIRTERAVNKNRKRTAEENADFNYNRKKKLNRNSWLEYNGKLTKPINQQCNGLTSNDMTITAQPNIVSKDEELNCKQYDDLRNQLNLKRSQRTDIQKLTLESECNNKNSAVLLGQINVEDKNDTIIMTKEQTKEIEKKLSVEKDPTLNETCYKEENNSQMNPDLHHDSCNNLDLLNTIQNPEEIMIENINEEQDANSIIDIEEDEDCISLFAESFDESRCEDIVSHKKKEPCQLLDSNKPYNMSAHSFDKYVKQNKCEFYEEYAKCKSNTEINTEMPSKSNETKELSNNQQKQTLCTNYVPSDIPRTATRVTPSIIENIDISQDKIKQAVTGYCFYILRKGTCRWKSYECKFNHNYQYLMDAICLREPRIIFEILQNISALNYNFFCEQTYIASLTKLSVEQILLIYAMLYDYNSKQDFTLSRDGIYHIVMELLKREMSLKTIVKRLVEYMPVKNMEKIDTILKCVDEYVKPGEYWNTVKILILQPSFQPMKYTVEKILKECINYENLVNIQDVNNTLMNKLDSALMSRLDKNLIECFKNLTKKTMQNSSSLTLIQDFGKDSAENIASPDSNTNEILLQVETPKKCDIVTATNIDTNRSYVIQPIDNLSDPRSIYRDHENLWIFYTDLDRFKKGLEHKDYDYVIDILKTYKEKKDENRFFIQSCCNILQTEIKRSECHLANIIRRTVQTDTCGILSEILFNLGLNILISLMNKEAWKLALSFISSLNIYDLLHDAEFYLLSAEVYLANKKAIKAFDLLKYKNIICTSRAKWHVKSTINDEYVRNKIMYILLDSFCNEYCEYAFFLFQFLLKDQSSQYYPIDLSRYVTKLIKLSLLTMNTTLITEMGSLILKYNFALSSITCRALISTLVHINETLAKQIYNYAEGIGIYSAVKLWPVMHVTLSTDLTEEEMYLIFLHLLKNVLMNLGPAIEFAKPYQIKVYLILEIKSTNEQFYCADLQNCYNNKAIINTLTLVKKVLKKRFDPPIFLMRNGSKGRIFRLQSTSLINYLKSEHC